MCEGAGLVTSGKGSEDSLAKLVVNGRCVRDRTFAAGRPGDGTADKLANSGDRA
jgi:hypothetical protein